MGLGWRLVTNECLTLQVSGLITAGQERSCCTKSPCNKTMGVRTHFWRQPCDNKIAWSTGRAALLWVGGAAGTLIQNQVFLWFHEFHENWCPPSVVWIQRYLLWFGISHHLCSQFPISPFRLSGQEGQANFGNLPPQNCPSRLVFERMCDSYLKNELALFLQMNVFLFFLHKNCVWGLERWLQLRMVKNSCCSYGVSEFGSQNPCWGAHRTCNCSTKGP